jgi:hypothetical protein
MASVTEMQPLAPSGYRRAPEMKEKVEASSIDLEAGNGETLYPGISRGENALRWGFIRKVYGILCAQLLLTTVVSAVTVFHPTLNATLSSSPVLALLLAVVPFIRKRSSLLPHLMLCLTLSWCVYVYASVMDLMIPRNSLTSPN